LNIDSLSTELREIEGLNKSEEGKWQIEDRQNGLIQNLRSLYADIDVTIEKKQGMEPMRNI
jgi:hypothetical protein